MAVRTGLEILPEMKGFLVANIGFFFLLMLFFNYAKYFLRVFPIIYKLVSPLVSAVSVTISAWVVGNMVLLAGELPSAIKEMAVFALGNLWAIFGFIAVAGYLALLAGLKGKKKR